MIFSLLDILSPEKYSSHPAVLLCNIRFYIIHAQRVDIINQIMYNVS